MGLSVCIIALLKGIAWTTDIYSMAKAHKAHFAQSELQLRMSIQIDGLLILRGNGV